MNRIDVRMCVRYSCPLCMYAFYVVCEIPLCTYVFMGALLCVRVMWCMKVVLGMYFGYVMYESYVCMRACYVCMCVCCVMICTHVCYVCMLCMRE